MKLAYNIRFLVFLLVVASCSLSKRQTTDEVDISGSHKIDLIVLDPGHFHASLLQKETLTDVSDTIRIYAPEGIAVNQYLESIDKICENTGDSFLNSSCRILWSILPPVRPS